MDFTALKTRVANETGMDLTVDDTIVASWVNQAYQYISGLFNWQWLFKNYTIQTVADITTGTVSVSAGGTNLTFSSAPTVSVANDYMIQFTTTNDWYFISSHTASSTSAVISVPYVGTSAYSSTYILRKVFYSLASDVDRIVDIRQSITKNKLMYVDARTLDRIIPDVNFVGSPLYYSLLGYDSSQNWRIGFLPTPNAIINLQVRYYARITELSASTDTPLIPPKWHSAIVFGALAMYGHPFIDDTRFKEAEMRFQQCIEEMEANNSHTPDQMIVVQPWDTRVASQPLKLRFPSDYPDWYR
jgi:hypothetical protein